MFDLGEKSPYLITFHGLTSGASERTWHNSPMVAATSRIAVDANYHFLIQSSGIVFALFRLISLLDLLR